MAFPVLRCEMACEVGCVLADGNDATQAAIARSRDFEGRTAIESRFKVRRRRLPTLGGRNAYANIARRVCGREQGR